MNSETFVEALRRYVMDAAIEDTIANLKNPPGRRVVRSERERSDWYNNLPPEQAEYVDGAIAAAAHQALFGVLAVLDGARTVDHEGGRFELAYVGGRRTLLNDPQGAGLHDLLNASN